MRWRRGSADRDRPVTELDLLAVDLETTGLDPSRHEVLSVGMVPVHGLSIALGGARGYAVRPAGPGGVGESAAVHGITDDTAAGARSLSEVLPVVLAALEGRVLLAHHARIETGFLDAACRGHGVALPDLVVVDTVRLQRRVLRRGRSHAQVADQELGLAAARRHLGLPRYRSHDALTDALACAELYLAQVAALAGDGTMTLRQLQ
ncbi:exonuclease domain-containing protein [Ornithinimicrobium cryptoxanthini]|uniref:Exonuclease domain-containing protein n=1 Tax=Ornithinimicrobium cryptoxanthini TaxID=2934161 RepID=A0ABY4YJM7_9MICO|nr:exonuclease domain-containing protein [Ornithinimicrobium cryptoxanthini]USQ76936.1 exonuclease domain-containing protein [Ornithinimicrobium cryptoxanthini]